MKVVVCSVPKSGTYLIGELLKLFGLADSGLHLNVHAFNDYRAADHASARREPNRFLIKEPLTRSVGRLQHGQYALSHLPPEAAYVLRHCELLFVYRNLRDVLVSFCRWTADTGRWQGETPEPWRSMPSSPQKLLGFLRAHRPHVVSTLMDAARWREMMAIPTVSFEELVGDFGQDRSLAATRTIAHVAGYQATSDDELARILRAALDAETMTRSQQRSERGLFWNTEVEDLFWETGLGELNLRLGYSEHRSPQAQASPRGTRLGFICRWIPARLTRHFSWD